MFKSLIRIFAFSLISFGSYAQCYELPVDTMRMFNDLHFLASKELAGRYPGSEGDVKARNFIISLLKEQGLEPYFGESFTQEFEIDLPVQISSKSNLTWAGSVYSIKNTGGIYPIFLSSSGFAKGNLTDVGQGIYAPDAQRNDYEWEKAPKKPIYLIDVSMPEGMHPHHKLAPYVSVSERVKAAQKHDAQAIILYNSAAEERSPQRFYTKLQSVGIPVVFISDKKFVEKLKSSKKKKLSINVELKPIKTNTTNIGAYLNHNSEKTLIVGAHYDHLGMGGAGSRYAGMAIHFGADDNSSGTVGLMELIRHHKKLPENYNYLFMFFGAEEMGLLGSKHFVSTDFFKKDETFAMLNLDMIGRLDSSIALSGTGTALEWDSLLEKINCEGIYLKKSPGGRGPSDHASFYGAGIPVLHYFTGLHNDYHKPTDTPDKIYYTGIAKQLEHLYSVIKHINETQTLTYQETEEQESRETPRFRVTMGIIPDYAFSGPGIRLDGVSQGKPAEKAGLKTGDIILKLGDTEIKDIRNYMEFLSLTGAGSKVKAQVKRADEIIELEIEF